MRRLAVVALLAACATPSPVDVGPVTIPPPEGATTTAPTTGPTGVTTTTADPGPMGETIGLSAYFLLEEAEPRDGRPGPFLVPVHHRVERTVAVGGAAMRRLLAGPTAAETEAGISTAVPEGTVLLGLSIEDGVATVDLSREFESGGGTFSMTARLAQVVYTLTQFPTVDRVELRLDGRPVEVFSSEGIVIEEPVGRDAYLDLLPFVFVDRPAWAAPAGNPLRMVGTANVFEATFQFSLTDAEGRVLEEGFATATCGTGCWGDFDVTIRYSIDEEGPGRLAVWTESARDGSLQDLREHPVTLEP